MADNLFSKYRPIDIESLFGHATVKKELLQRIKDKNLPKVILITGKTGTGKTTIEKILSKTILCKESSPCGICDQCQTVINEKMSNYYYLFNASNLGIDDMRAIEEISQKRNLSTIPDKVIVIDELQELGNQQKSLKSILKILEKPLPHIYYFLLAMDESKIPSALKNRCVHYRLHDLSYEEIANQLLQICEKENIVIDTEDKANTLLTISQNSDGSMRTAIAHLERCIYSELWNPKTVLDELGIISNDGLVMIMNQLLSGDVKLLENEITKDLLEKIRWILNLLYKSKAGVELNGYQKSYLKGIIKTDMNRVYSIIEGLNTLTYYPYTTQELIDFTLINAMKGNRVIYEADVDTDAIPSTGVKVRERKKA